MTVNMRKIEDGANDAPDPRDEEMRKIRAQLEGLTILVERVMSSSDRPATISQAEAEAKAEPLETVADERARIRAAWDAEPKVMISIAPSDEDDLIRNEARARFRDPNLDYLPRTFQVNGVQLHIPVGKLTHVPLSIARMYEYMLNPWQARGITPPVTFEQNSERLGLAA